MTDIFLSYAHEDEMRAKALIPALKEQGWNVWWDDRVRTGEDFVEEINRALAEARCVIVLWSAAALESPWVKGEATAAFDHRKLLPILIDDVPIPVPFNRVQATRLVDWPERRDPVQLEKLFSAVSEIIQKPVQAPLWRPDYIRTWVPKVIVTLNLLLVVWLFRTLFFYYHPLASLTNAALVMVALVSLISFQLSSTRPTVDRALSTLFLQGSGRVRVQPAVIGVTVSAALVIASVLVRPSLRIEKIAASIDTLEPGFQGNLLNRSGGVDRPQNGFVLLTVDTGYNTLEDFTLSVSLFPYGAIEFADFQTDRALGFDNQLSLVSPQEGKIDVPGARLRGVARVRVRWKHAEFLEPPEDAMLEARLVLGEWMDHVGFPLWE